MDQNTLVSSSRQMDWNGILVEQYQYSPTLSEVELPALSAHWFLLNLGQPFYLTQKHGDRIHESMIQKGDSMFVPAGQPSYWLCHRSDTHRPMLNIHLPSELIGQVAKTSEIDPNQIDLVNHFGKQDLNLQHIAMLLLAELRSGSMMGRLYVESLTQVLVIHLLRHYAKSIQINTSENRNLTRTQLQQAIDYIHTYLDRDLSLAELASIVNISPTYFASLFKQAMGIAPHQYVIQQRVEQAKLMLSKTDLAITRRVRFAIADIALQVGFSSQSHLTQQFKRVTGLTPKQIRPSP
ncbi:MAG: AraC family transcriptional regulator [Chroococcidiopsis sp.]